MTESSPAELLVLIADEFDRRRWEYTPAMGLALRAEIERTGLVDPESLAQRVPGDFLHSAGVDRSVVESAIQAAVGGHTVGAPQKSAVLHFEDNRTYEVKLGPGAQINNSNLSLGDGQQINVDTSAPVPQVLAAVEAVVLAGLSGEWNSAAAADLSNVIAARGDVTVNNIRELTVNTVQTQNATRGRVDAFMEAVAKSTVSGLLTTGIAAGLGEVLPHLLH